MCKGLRSMCCVLEKMYLFYKQLAQVPGVVRGIFKKNELKKLNFVKK